MKNDILIIGAGPAGFNAAKAAAKCGRSVVLAGEEPLPPYWRPRLPDIIRTGAPTDSILMQRADWYEANHIQFLQSKKAVSIDPDQKRVYWEDGGSADYQTLIMACGAQPNIPSVPFAEHVYPLRTYMDAIAIRGECARKGKAFVVGGGVLGLETAFAAAQLGCSVTVCDRNDYPLSRQLDREGGLFLKSLLEKEGVAIRTGESIETLREEIEGACVIAAAGVRPDIGLAASCDTRTNRGILVDGGMRTSVPDLYACGDIAEFLGAVPGLMTIAAKQGETAGLCAAGEDAVYQAVLPSPLMKVAGISVLSIGSVQVDGAAKAYRRLHGSDYAVAVITDGIITGAAFIGNTSLGMKFKTYIESAMEIGDVASFDEILAKIK